MNFFKVTNIPSLFSNDVLKTQNCNDISDEINLLVSIVSLEADASLQVKPTDQDTSTNTVPFIDDIAIFQVGDETGVIDFVAIGKDEVEIMTYALNCKLEIIMKNISFHSFDGRIFLETGSLGTLQCPENRNEKERKVNLINNVSIQLQFIQKIKT